MQSLVQDNVKCALIWETSQSQTQYNVCHADALYMNAALSQRKRKEKQNACVGFHHVIRRSKPSL